MLGRSVRYLARAGIAVALDCKDAIQPLALMAYSIWLWADTFAAANEFAPTKQSDAGSNRAIKCKSLS